MSLLLLSKETGPPKLSKTGIGDFLEPPKLVPFSGVTITMRLTGQNNPHMFVVQFGVNSLEQSISSFDVISNKWKIREGTTCFTNQLGTGSLKYFFPPEILYLDEQNFGKLM